MSGLPSPLKSAIVSGPRQPERDCPWRKVPPPSLIRISSWFGSVGPLIDKQTAKSGLPSEIAGRDTGFSGSDGHRRTLPERPIAVAQQQLELGYIADGRINAGAGIY